MVRQSLLILFVALAACSRPAAPFAFPETAGEWTLAGPPAAAAELMPSAKRAWRGAYRGSPEMTLTVYEMNDGTAFEAVQKSRVQPGKMVTYKGNYFFVAESPGADYRVLDRFIAAVVSKSN